MRTRRLGSRGPSVPAMGLGCMGMSQSYGPADESESVATLHRALELGVTFLDTADIYGQSANEKLVGAAIRGHRDEVFLATKCGFVPGDPGGPNRLDGSPEHIREACDASLSRLGTSTIDLYYLHRVDPKIPVEESVRAMAGLVDAGKVRFLGLSEISPATLRRACAVAPITAVQSEYSLWTREPEDGVLPTCRELGVGFVPFSPLGRGFLTGTIRGVDGLAANDFRRAVPRFQAKHVAKNLSALRPLGELAAEKGCTTAQLALAWVLAQGSDIVTHPRHQAAPVPRRECGRHRAEPLLGKISSGSTRPCRRGPRAGNATPPRSRPSSSGSTRFRSLPIRIPGSSRAPGRNVPHPPEESGGTGRSRWFPSRRLEIVSGVPSDRAGLLVPELWGARGRGGTVLLVLREFHPGLPATRERASEHAFPSSGAAPRYPGPRGGAAPRTGRSRLFLIIVVVVVVILVVSVVGYLLLTPSVTADPGGPDRDLVPRQRLRARIQPHPVLRVQFLHG